MKDPIELALNLRDNPPRFPYEPNSVGDKAAETYWKQGLNSFIALWEKNKPSEVGEDYLPPSPRDEGSD